MTANQYLHKLEGLHSALEGATLRRCICVLFLLLALGAVAHTLPVSYLRLVPEADYLHLELGFNPFEMSFVAEVDDNKDRELVPGELEAESDLGKPGASAAKR